VEQVTTSVGTTLLTLAVTQQTWNAGFATDSGWFCYCTCDFTRDIPRLNASINLMDDPHVKPMGDVRRSALPYG
jgi:hypothetical protein